MPQNVSLGCKYLRAIQNAERLHGGPLWFPSDEQSPLRSGIPYNLIMTLTKSQKRQRRLARKQNNQLVVYNGQGGLAKKYANTPQSQALFRPNKLENGPIYDISFDRARRRKRGRAASQHSTLPPMVSAYLDPFSEEAGCVKYPDSFRGLTGNVTTSDLRYLQTYPAAAFTDGNLSGVVAPRTDTSLMVFTADPSLQCVQGVVGTPPSGSFAAGVSETFLWPNGNNPFTNVAGTENFFGASTGNIGIDYVSNSIGSIRRQFNALRLVSGGMKITGVQNFSTVSGTIHVAPVFIPFAQMTDNLMFVGGGQERVQDYEITAGWQTALPNSLSDMSALPGYQAYPMSSLQSGDLVCLFKRSGPAALNFKPSTTAWCLNDQNSDQPENRMGANNNPVDTGHYAIIVLIEGALNSTGAALPAAANLARVQLRCHYECTFQNRGIQFGASGSGALLAANIGSVPDAHMSPPHQPLLLAAADNLSTAVPAVREVSADGDSEEGFYETVSNLWNTATGIAKSTSAVYDVLTTAIATLVL